jgi:hypothetical protein
MTTQQNVTSIVPPMIRVTDVGEYVRHQSCQRRFRLGFNDQAEFRKLPFSGSPVQAIDPVLQEHGKMREEQWALRLVDHGFRELQKPANAPNIHGVKVFPWNDFLDALATVQPGERVFADEVVVEAQVGAFHLQGRVDFIVLDWCEGQPRLTLAECKASRRDKTYQRLQVVLYRMIIAQMVKTRALEVNTQSVEPASLRCCVVRVDEATNTLPDFDQLVPVVSSHQLEEDLRQLLASHGALAQSLVGPLEELPYQLDSKCDDCTFSLHCFPESARLRRLELLGLSPGAVRQLKAAGITTLDALAELDLTSPAARQLATCDELMEPLDGLVVRARARRARLPASAGDDFDVMVLPNRGAGQLPAHRSQVEGAPPLVRIYLSINQDYTEHRIAALAAHVTTSEGLYKTRWTGGEQSAPDPVPVEVLPDGTVRPVQGQSIVKIANARWTGDEGRDAGIEEQLMREFFRELTDAILRAGRRAKFEAMPIHFYVWSAREITLLMEACTRIGPHMLGYLRELFGCRDQLEQLIFSSVGEEIDDRYALGWTGRSLAIATSLGWFGESFHWTRIVEEEVYRFDKEMSRDLFDFRTFLTLDAQGEWTDKKGQNTRDVRTEVRSHFFDQLSSPYLWGYWKALPELRKALSHKGKLDKKLDKVLQDYERAAGLGVLVAYMQARVEAVRWVEERVKFKNNFIEKPAMKLGDLPHFKLETMDVASAAVDFLRLDHHVGFNEWLRALLAPPMLRIARGTCLPLCELEATGPNKARARIDTRQVDVEQLRTRCTIQEGSFQRMHPRDPDLQKNQRIAAFTRYGATCVVEKLDWDTGIVELGIIPNYEESYYIARSNGCSQGEPVLGVAIMQSSGKKWKIETAIPEATLDPSISDFVANQVEKRLDLYKIKDKKDSDADSDIATTQPTNPPPHPPGHHALGWFDTTRPIIPPQPSLPAGQPSALRAMLEAMRTADGQRSIDPSRVEMILAGLETRVQLVQGPPGTGKTQLTAQAIMTRILAGFQPGDIVLIGAHTHTAVATLLSRIYMLQEEFRAAAPQLPGLALLKIDGEEGVEGVESIADEPPWKVLNEPAKAGKVIIIGGTINGLIKCARHFDKPDKHVTFKTRYGRFSTHLLVIDEASMMVSAHFLALATLTEPTGQIMLAGDNRQLSPIVSHKWDEEDRPPAQRFQMHVSAFDAIANLCPPPGKKHQGPNGPASVRRDGIDDSYRLPAEVVDVLKPLYELDAITLTSAKEGATQLVPLPAELGVMGLEAAWLLERNVFLLLHDEQQSRQMNTLEIALIQQLLNAGERTGELKPSSVAVITPHRAQRATLKRELKSWVDSGHVTMIDTVERLQGGEQETIVFSGTVSDPVAIAQTAEFILDLKRSNVAFSRPKKRLVVVCSKALLNHIPTDVRHYDAALLWKGLRELCAREVARGQEQGHAWQLLVRER